MSTNNIQFNDKIRKKSLNIFFSGAILKTSWGLKNEFELAMVNKRATEVRLYLVFIFQFVHKNISCCTH